MSVSIPPASNADSVNVGLGRKEDQQHQHQQQQKHLLQTRGRNDSSGTDSTDSAITLSSLGESLPSPNINHHADETHATSGYEDSDSRENAEEEVDEHEKELRRYSVEIAAHTAHMFEECYGGVIPEAQSNTASDGFERTNSANSNRNSAGRPPSSTDNQEGKRRSSTSHAMERSI